MSESTYVQVAVPCPLRRLFDYQLPANLTHEITPGCRVRVPWRNGHKIGIVISSSTSTNLPKDKIKDVTEVIDHEPIIDRQVMQLCKFASDYYQYGLGEVIQNALPKRLRLDKPLLDLEKEAKKFEVPELTPEQALELSPEQQAAVTAIQQAENDYQCFLLQGVTGSGKTEVYLQALQQLLRAGKQALLLVPEISLTPQTIRRVERRFGKPVQPIHSGMTEKQRLLGWQKAKEGIADIVIGTRSALFTPFKDLGLIIIDEEHDLSFKQQDGFRYSARDLAIYRAKQLKIPLVLGSATPALESLYNVQQGRYQKLLLSQRAGNAKPPTPQLIDLKADKAQHGLTATALKEVRKTLEAGQQALVFLNRRGYSPSIFCTNCHWLAQCGACDRPYTYHQQERSLRCHHCNGINALPKLCPNCNADKLKPLGSGTERLEDYLREKFPDTPLTRIDRDTTSRKGKLEELLENANADGAHLLIGTQMLAKGHHFPKLTLVVIVDADQALYSGDIFALERLGQLVTQVSGRSGRAKAPGKVLVQTRFPENQYLQQLLHASYQEFAETLLAEREQAGLPPFAHFSMFRAEAKTIQLSLDFLNQLREQHASQQLPAKILGPIPAAMPKRQGMHRAQLLLQAPSRADIYVATKSLLQTIEHLRLGSRLRWSVDVDPKEIF